MRDSDLQRAIHLFDQRLDSALEQSDEQTNAAAMADYRRVYKEYLSSAAEDRRDAADRLERVINEVCGADGELRPIRETLVDAHSMLRSDQPEPGLASKLRWAQCAAEVLAPESDDTRILDSVFRGITSLRLAA